MEYQKVKSVSKQVRTKGNSLEKIILDTMRTISEIVGATLGPGGQQVLIERQEHNLPPMVTKDGVTVFRSLGFDDPSAHSIMEAARDASVRTASEAGDGTTTATILAEAIVRKTHEFTRNNPRVSPQKVVRRLEKAFREVIEPTIKKMAVSAKLTQTNGRSLLRSVAKVSANGDDELADAVMECFDLVGDDGNVTIAEVSGPSKYEVEKIEGYPISMGYEESCAKYYQKFINDAATQRCVLEKPVFILYHGRITEFQSMLSLLDMIGQAWQSRGYNHNIVVVATGFSEQVLSALAFNFAEPTSLNVFPLLVPQSPLLNGQLEFLQDLSAITGANILDPMNKPMDQAILDDLGPSVTYFEANRFRSNVVGKSSSPEGASMQEECILYRVDELHIQKNNAASELEKTFIQERIGKLTGGIARLKVIGASNGELKEKRDRAEDAVCAVRGAIKHGCLPGGGWTLLKLMNVLKNDKDVVLDQVLIPALFEPVLRLLSNVGVNDDEAVKILEPVISSLSSGNPDAATVYDALEGKHVNAVQSGILDATPAVLEAVRNSISIASLLGTLGGTVVFKRDLDLERTEARDSAEFLRNANWNPANERA